MMAPAPEAAPAPPALPEMIVRQIEDWPVARLRPYPQNAKTHTAEDIAATAASIAEFGWTFPILVDEDGVIIAGHGRYFAATTVLHLATVPVLVARGWPEAKKRAYRIADNRLSENAVWDDALLRIEVTGLLDAGFDIRVTGLHDEDLARLSIGVLGTEFPALSDAVRGDFRAVTFTLHKDQAEVIEQAVTAAKSKGAFNGVNPNSNGNAIARICETYLEWHQQKTSE